MALESFYPENIKHITLKDHDCIYVDMGYGTPVIFLQGFATNITIFDGNYPDFSATRRVIAFDYPGYYLSEKKANTPYNLGYMADAVCELIEKLSVENVVLVGSSMGGAIAIETAKRCPDRLSAMVLIAPSGFSGRAPVKARIMGVQEKLVPAEFFRKKFFDTLLLRADTFFVDKEHPKKDAFIAQYYLMKDRDDFDLWIGTLTRMARATLSADNRTGLEDITIPTYIMWGDSDEALPVEGSYIAHDAFEDNATLEVIPNAGHIFFVEQPALFFEKVDGYLKSKGL
ncbi:MAG: alpha/beta hydrolase [Deltaproteobacteria bacterium]|nr:alpha/beta hydrolase [Candidatus Zymogenaceae bacterium]